MIVDSCLVLAVSPHKAGKAVADSGCVVADAPSGAVTPSLVAVPVHWVGGGRAFLQVACGASVARVAHASDVLHAIPRDVVSPLRRAGELHLRPALTSVRAVFRAHCSLTRDTLVACKALASSGLTVTVSFIATFCPRMQVVCTHDGTHPREVLGARALAAVRTSPLRLVVEALVAHTVAIVLTYAVTTARVFAVAALAHPVLLVPNDLAPSLCLVGRHRGRRVRRRCFHVLSNNTRENNKKKRKNIFSNEKHPILHSI